MNSYKLGILMLATVLILAGCSTSRKPESVLPSDGKVEGTLTINGKTFPLKYVYAGRVDPAEITGPGGIDVLVTDEPLTYETLSKILLELEVSPFTRRGSKVMKDSAVNALHFGISELQLDIAGGGSECAFDGMLMTSDSLSDYSSVNEVRTHFDEFSFKEGTVRGKAANKWEQIEIGEELQEIKTAAQYSLSFEAKVGGQSLLLRSLSPENKWWQESLSRIPEEGKAHGTLTVSKRTADLTHAYAIENLRGRAGETIEGITVLLSDRPIRKELLLLSIDRRVDLDGYVLRLSIDKSGALVGSQITHPYGFTSGLDQTTSLKAFIVENGRVTGSAEEGSTSTDPDPSEQNHYSVSFDAPLRK
jgi:hypothetical protein